MVIIILIMCLFYLESTIAIEINLAILQDVQNENSEAIIQTVKEKIQETYEGTVINHEVILWKAESSDEMIESFSQVLKSEHMPWDIILDFTQNVTLYNEAMENVNVPIISTNYGGFNKRNLCSGANNIIHINPPDDVIVDVIRDIVVQLNRSNAMVLYDDTFGMKNKYQSLLRNIPTRHILLHLDMHPDKMRTQMENLKEIDISNFFVLASEENLKNILIKIEEHSMFTKNIAWYAISKDVLKQDFLPCDDCKLLTANPVITYTAFLEKIQEIMIPPHSVLDVSFMYDILLQSLMSFVKTKITNENKIPTGADLLHQMEQMNYVGVLGKYVFNGSCNNYAQIKLELKKLKKESGSPQITSVVGRWTYGKENKNIFFTNANMKEFLPLTMYRIVTYVKPPFVYKTIEKDGTIKFEGICVDLMNKLKIILNFEYVLYEISPDDAKSTEVNGEWTGLIGEVVSRNADIALAPVFITSDTERVVDFTIPYYDLVGLKILMMKPIIETSMFRFLTVMEANVWFSILGAYVFTSILLWFIDRLSPFSYQNNKDKFINDSEKREFTLTECLWFCVTSLTPQGGGEAPKNVSGRMLAATWWLFSFIVIASYTANLAAFLTVSRLDNPIDSLDGLANQYKVQYAPVNGSVAMQYFQRMAFIENKFFEKWKDMTMGDAISEEERTQFSVWEYPVSDRYTKIWQAILETGMPETFEEGIERIRNTSGDFAVIADVTDVRYATMINCDLVEVGEEFSRRPLGLVVNKGSLLKDKLSLAILHLQNKRELENLKERWWTNNEHKVDCDEGDTNTDGISIKNIGGVFIVIFVGMIVAWMVLAFEYWWHRIYKKDQVQAFETNKIKALDTIPNYFKRDKEITKFENTVTDKKQNKRYVFTTE